MIPQLPPGNGNGNVAHAISSSGQFVVGESDSSSTPGVVIEDGFRYDRTIGAGLGGLTSIGALNASTYSSHATGVSGDGVVVGYSKQLVGSTNVQRACVWRPASGLSSIGVHSGAGASFAYAISADGSTVVGNTSAAGFTSGQAFRWTQIGGFALLPALPGGGASSARAVSANGSVIVGDSAGVPFRWTSAGGASGTTTALPALPGAGDNFGEALGVNASGSVVVGSMTSATFIDSSLGFPIPQPEAFRWTAAGSRPLGALASSGTQTSEAFAVSADGVVIVGDSQTSGTLGAPVTEAFVWTPRWGMARLADKLGAASPLGVRLDTASGISSDGRTICGSGTDLAASRPFAFVATIRYCPGDHNDSGTLEVQDIFDFLGDWFAGQSKADANASGRLEVQDIFDFLNAWFAGC